MHTKPGPQHASIGLPTEPAQSTAAPAKHADSGADSDAEGDCASETPRTEWLSLLEQNDTALPAGAEIQSGSGVSRKRISSEVVSVAVYCQSGPATAPATQRHARVVVEVGPPPTPSGLLPASCAQASKRLSLQDVILDSGEHSAAAVARSRTRLLAFLEL